ncbi:hypothetical protein GG804_20100 [Sphingomonas histidinilytica]|nr:hypothetical protein [Rhizorhabdus histidinilytica]
MAKDPNYDRYKGIVTLPNPWGPPPRPYRVDEDGRIIYRDQERPHATEREGQGAIVGGAARSAQLLDKNARVREKYVADVANLNRFDNAGRAALKEYWREPTPREIRALVKAIRPSTAAREGSYGDLMSPIRKSTRLLASWAGSAGERVWRELVLPLRISRRQRIHGGLGLRMSGQ